MQPLLCHGSIWWIRHEYTGHGSEESCQTDVVLLFPVLASTALEATVGLCNASLPLGFACLFPPLPAFLKAGLSSFLLLAWCWE